MNQQNTVESRVLSILKDCPRARFDDMILIMHYYNRYATYVGTKTVSWMCILGAAPFAALGFIKYNGMTAEKFVWAWFKSEFLMPKKLTFRSTNTYYEMMKPGMEHKQKEVSKAND